MKETTYVIESKKIKRPISIALVSDLHNENGNEVIASLKKHEASKPYSVDLIAITGDFLIGRKAYNGVPVVKQYENVLPFVYACAEIAPTFISLGNHEWMIENEDKELLEKTGATVLDNQWIRFRLPSAPNLIVGGLTSSIVTYYRSLGIIPSRTAHYPSDHNQAPTNQLTVKSITKASHNHTAPSAPTKASRYHTDHNAPTSDWLTDFESQDGIKILLSHHPEYWNLKEPFLSKRPIDLVLSGHAHGGQFRFFGRGILSPGQGLLPKYTSGVHSGPHGNLVISRGLANTAHPLPRLFNPTEIVYIHYLPVSSE